jgi:hypothetical protein
MHSTALKRLSGRSTVPCVAVGTFFIGILLLQGFLLFTPVQAQDFKPEKFDKSLLDDSLVEQEILRKEMILEQEILREEMEQIRLEMQRIMEEIKREMKEEALKLRAELWGCNWKP